MTLASRRARVRVCVRAHVCVGGPSRVLTESGVVLRPGDAPSERQRAVGGLTCQQLAIIASSRQSGAQIISRDASQMNHRVLREPQKKIETSEITGGYLSISGGGSTLFWGFLYSNCP